LPLLLLSSLVERERLAEKRVSKPPLDTLQKGIERRLFHLRSSMETIGILYEHPEWFRPLFRELNRRGLAYDPIHAGELRLDPEAATRYALVVNRMSPSAFLRGSGHAIFSTFHYLSYLHELGVPTVNGKDAYAVEISKTVQLAILRRLGLRHPPTRVINNPALALEAASGLRFPVLIKPNVGGSGAGIRTRTLIS
jgi:hypothetical protein